jgi:hypothetical protein
MEKLEWHPFYYNGFETNIEATKCGRLRKVEKDWYGKGKGSSHIKYGEIIYQLKKISNSGYYMIRVCIKNNLNRPFFVHQIIAATFLNYKFGNRNIVIDHINSDKLNNKLSNLTILSQRENCSKEKTIISGMPVGVHFHKPLKKYVSRIHFNGKKHHLGYFNSIEEASFAYQNKLKTI